MFNELLGDYVVESVTLQRDGKNNRRKIIMRNNRYKGIKVYNFPFELNYARIKINPALNL